ncbi:MAG TPA: hypothetical protein VFX19_13930, partial [Dehalococcoidia bacterium]|nr:hypothetical protein [Dehalococcoidia bacterium]
MTAEAVKKKPVRTGQPEQPQMRLAAAGAPHLAHYLRTLQEEGIEEPQYFEEITRKTAPSSKNKNLLYRVDDDIYVHILSNEEDARDSYIAIEPVTEDLSGYIKLLESALLDYVDELEAAETDDDKRLVLLKAVEENVKVVGGHSPKGGGKNKGFGRRGNGGDDAIDLAVTSEQYAALQYVIVRNKIGMGVLEPLIRDPNIEDISCSGLGNLFIEHKIFGALNASIRFDEMEDLDNFVVRLSEKIKKPVTFKNP